MRVLRRGGVPALRCSASSDAAALR